MQEYRDPPPAGMPQFVWPSLTPVVRQLLWVNGILFLATWLLFLVAEPFYVTVLSKGVMLNPGQWKSAFPFVPVWQLLTYAFLHSPMSLWHIVGNMLLIYFFGTMLEREIGSQRFLFTYLMAAAAGGLFYLVWSALMPMGPVAGASGAAFGIVFAAAWLFPQRTVYLLFIPLTLRVLALFLGAFAVFALINSLKLGPTRVADSAHVGGALYGLAAAKLGWLRVDPLAWWGARQAQRAREKDVGDKERVDALLDRIHKEGIQSLSASDRRFLKRVSKTQ